MREAPACRPAPGTRSLALVGELRLPAAANVVPAGSAREARGPAVDRLRPPGEEPSEVARRAASDAERARISVTRAIRAAMSRIGEQSPELGRHLEGTIRTGTYCSYNPDSRLRTSWDV